MSNMLQDIIAHVESSDNQFAVRFEPLTYQNKPLWILGTLPNIQEAHYCDYDTALMIACTSWGYFQLLGANVFADGLWKSNVFDFMEVAEAQTQGFARFIAPQGFIPTETIDTWDEARFEKFASFFNGPANIPDYVSRMKNARV